MPRSTAGIVRDAAGVVPPGVIPDALDPSSLESRTHREVREIREPRFLLDLPDLSP